MRILVLNAGSSSLKCDVWDMHPEQRLSHSNIERSDSGAELAGIEGEFEAVGHRVVHGGDRFREPVRIDDVVEHAIEELCELAPLHNPRNLEVIRAARKRWPKVPHVAVFDTAFHHTIPPHAYIYGLPYEYLTERKVRRYGFHGISHQYVSQRAAELKGGKPEDFCFITCHLGNGCSVCAIDRGRSIDTSMGFTPLEGLIMGTRSGDLDPGAVLYLAGKGVDLSRVLNHESGLKGLSGISNDMRDILAREAEGDERAKLAVDAFCYRVRKYIGAYSAILPKVDSVIFTGGIGENSPGIRGRIWPNTEVIPTNEELLIARYTEQLAR